MAKAVVDTTHERRIPIETWLPVEEARVALTFPIERSWLERALAV